MKSTNKNHWETVYATKTPDQVSWTQAVPQTSLDFIASFNMPKSASIIDIGGGDSNLVDFLLDAGYTNVSVLDISANAIERAKLRLGEKANAVTWIVSDITAFEPTTSYDIWHDRATFHFLTTEQQIKTYQQIINKAVSGYIALGTFSVDGPTKCSGLEIKQYSEASLTSILANGFEKLNCLIEDHITPFATKQNFIFCSFKKRI